MNAVSPRPVMGRPPCSISVIIPVYNGAAYLTEAVDSVLRQTLLPSEIIVVDDGSTDASSEIIASLATGAPVPIHYLHQSNHGPGAARNRGLEAAAEDVIAFLDQDDVWLPTKLEQQWGVLAARPEAGLATARTRFFLADGFRRPPWVRPELLADASGSATLMPSALLIRREIVCRVGLFNELLRVSSDLAWVARARQEGVTIASVDEVLILHRIHAGNQSRHVRDFHRELLQIARRYAAARDP